MNKLTELLQVVKKWLLANLMTIVVLVVIIITGILIDLYGTDISTNTVNVILAVGAGISTFFLYLTFIEARKTNEIKLSEQKFNDFINEIKRLEDEAIQCIFSEPQLISSKFNYKHDSIACINILNFLSLIDLYNAIRIDNEYMFCTDKLMNTDEAEIIYDTRIKELDTSMNQIYEGNRKIMSFIIRISSLYNDIDRYNLNLKQKKYLFDRLSKLHAAYTEFYINFRNKESGIYPIFKSFYEFKVIKYIGSNKISFYRIDVQWQFVFAACKDIENILNRY